MSIRHVLSRVVVGTALVAGVLGGCGGDSDDSAGTTTTTVESTTSEATTTSTSEPTTTTTEATTTEATTTTTEQPPVTLEQPAAWPAPATVFDDPLDAAADFVSTALGVEPNLGEFMQGDSRSGEVEVYSADEGGGTVVRSILLLRQLGADDGWYVLAAINEANTITAPESMSVFTPGDVVVAGEGRGFEATLIVQAFVAGATTPLDEVVTSGGALEDTEPYSVTLDLSGAEFGDTVVLIVRGGVGLADDPGEFSAIPIVIG